MVNFAGTEQAEWREKDVPVEIKKYDFEMPPTFLTDTGVQWNELHRGLNSVRDVRNAACHMRRLNAQGCVHYWDTWLWAAQYLFVTMARLENAQMVYKYRKEVKRMAFGVWRKLSDMPTEPIRHRDRDWKWRRGGKTFTNPTYRDRPKEEVARAIFREEWGHLTLYEKQSLDYMGDWVIDFRTTQEYRGKSVKQRGLHHHVTKKLLAVLKANYYLKREMEAEAEEQARAQAIAQAKAAKAAKPTKPTKPAKPAYPAKPATAVDPWAINWEGNADESDADVVESDSDDESNLPATPRPKRTMTKKVLNFFTPNKRGGPSGAARFASSRPYEAPSFETEVLGAGRKRKMVEDEGFEFMRIGKKPRATNGVGVVEGLPRRVTRQVARERGYL